MLLLDVGEESSIAEIGLATRALKISRLDADGEIILIWILFVHVMFFGKTIIYKMRI